MEDFIVNYYDKVREILIKANSGNADYGELDFYMETIERRFSNEIEKRDGGIWEEYDGQDAIEGLFEKYDLLFRNGLYIARDRESRLALSQYSVFEYTPSRSYPDLTPLDIQKDIVSFISRRVKTADDEFSTPLIKNEVKNKISAIKYDCLAKYLLLLSHEFTDYVNYYDNGYWLWQRDIKFLGQYVFEKVAEMTFYTIKGKSIDELSYNVTDAFTYFQISVPEKIQERLNGAVLKLQRVISEIVEYIVHKEYHLLYDKEVWFRPIIFNMALDGMLYLCEQEL